MMTPCSMRSSPLWSRVDEERKGVDKAKFLETFNSFGIQTRVKRAPELFDISGVNAVPGFLVNGQFATSPQEARGTDQLFTVLNKYLSMLPYF